MRAFFELVPHKMSIAEGLHDGFFSTSATEGEHTKQGCGPGLWYIVLL